MQLEHLTYAQLKALYKAVVPKGAQVKIKTRVQVLKELENHFDRVGMMSDFKDEKERRQEEAE